MVIGDWELGNRPNPQSTIPNPQSPFEINFIIFKNKNLYNHSLKRPISNTHKNLNLLPLFIQISKKGSQNSKLKKGEISLGKNKNLNINNISNNNNHNNNQVHSNSSLYINFFSPVHNPQFFQNKKNN